MVTLNYNGQELDFTSDELARAISHDYHCLDKIFYTKDDLYRHIADICETSYHESVDKLLENLKDRLA